MDLIDSTVKRAMIIVAHPDDPEFFCGGTIACWIKQGIEVSYLILTNGNKGSKDPNIIPEQLVAIRENEQRNAANVLGVKEVIFLGENDGELSYTLQLRQHVVRELRRFRPQIVITTDPTCYLIYGTRINHADHRMAGEIAFNAVFPATGSPMYHPELLAEGLKPHSINCMYLTCTHAPNLQVDITDTCEIKLQAISCHASQITNFSQLAERMRNRNKATDKHGNTIYQEGFRHVTFS
ncbi:MAG: hypothetical protein B6242_04585 [Anaerolineaceae bacterium 4572_78]|nr:MAG: hypothetical protein B6242_04585 [Anaerolineaceae bacterium 4572_78]